MLTTLLAGRLRNTSLPKAHALLPLFEAVVNSIQAIDERDKFGQLDGRIDVFIERPAQGVLDDSDPSDISSLPITGFRIKDNGIGFTPENQESFQTLDSDYKTRKGCRGVGRLLWLKAFNKVHIDSAYRNDNQTLQTIGINFSISHEVETGTTEEQFVDSGTTITLRDFKDEYRSRALKTRDAIAKALFEHCLWFFLRSGGAPTIYVHDGDGQSSLDEIFEGMNPSDQRVTSFTIAKVAFSLVQLKLRSQSSVRKPILYWCAGDRVVIDDNLAGKVPGLFGSLEDSESKFTYSCFLSSDFLDRNVRADRTAFDIDETQTSTLMEDDPLSLSGIRNHVLEETKQFLSAELRETRQRGEERLHDFIMHKEPRYRPLEKLFKQKEITIDPAVSNKDLELQLHKQLQDAQHEVFQQGSTIMSEIHKNFDDPDFQTRLEDYSSRVTELNKSELAAYVSGRRVILELLAKALESNSQGKYSKEAAIHSLLMPMRTDSDSVSSEHSNLWVVDERLAFHDYLASDLPFRSMPITCSQSSDRPDILSTQLLDTPTLTSDGTSPLLATVTIIEFKRPMRDDATTDDKNPINQVFSYLAKIKNNKALTANGREILVDPNVPASCYIIADLTESIRNQCLAAGYMLSPDHLSYYGQNSNYNATIQVISFDGLLKSAEERNNAFFTKLGLPTSRD